MMAAAGNICIAEVEKLVPAGTLDPNEIHVPGIYVQRIFEGKNYEKRIEQRTVSSPPSPPAPNGGAKVTPPLGAGGLSITSNTFGDILQPQPAPWLYWVNLYDFKSVVISDSNLRSKRSASKHFLRDTVVCSNN